MGTSRRQAGFTLIELMVALSILAITLAFAIPSFESIVNSNRLAGAANEMMAALQSARMESMRFNKRAVVCSSAAPNAASPTCSTTNPTGWIAFVDADKSGTFNAGDTLLRAMTVSGAVQIKWNANVGGKVTFRSDGMARTNAGALLNGTIDMCLPTTKPTTNVRHVFIGSGSRLSVNTPIPTPSATCSYTVADPT